MRHYLLRVLLNFFSWAFIGIAFVVVAVLAEQMGIARTTAPIVGIASFINSPFIFATLLGLALMTLCTLVIGRIVIVRRHRRPASKATQHFVSDADAEEMFTSEIVNQINGIANLALVICLLTLLDQTIGQKIFASPEVGLGMLAGISFALYAIAGGVFYGALKPERGAVAGEAACPPRCSRTAHPCCSCCCCCCCCRRQCAPVSPQPAAMPAAAPAAVATSAP